MSKINEKDLVEVLYPYFLKKLKKDSSFKNYVKRKNANVKSIPNVISNIGEMVEVALPYDTVSFCVRNESGKELAVNDLVCIEYCIDLKNAVVVYKVN